ncbi:hypothetical protein L915_09261, partial [Phytophthora nicotianae]
RRHLILPAPLVTSFSRNALNRVRNPVTARGGTRQQEERAWSFS